MRIVNLHHRAFVPTFRKLGHEVLSIGTTPDCDVVLSEPLSHKRFLELLAGRDLRPDLVFWCDACQLPWIFGLESLPAVVIGYSVDQYMSHSSPLARSMREGLSLGASNVLCSRTPRAWLARSASRRRKSDVSR